MCWRDWIKRRETQPSSFEADLRRLGGGDVCHATLLHFPEEKTVSFNSGKRVTASLTDLAFDLLDMAYRYTLRVASAFVGHSRYFAVIGFQHVRHE